MPELSVVVRVGESPPATYCFDRFPVLVGRSPSSHLSICHECVPRELLTAWLENNGRSVRIEERPDLKNPLLFEGAPLAGGVSGPRLEVSVGPVTLTLFNSASEDALNSRPHGIRRAACLGFAAVAVMVVVLFALPALKTPTAVSPEVAVSIPAELTFPTIPVLPNEGASFVPTLVQEAEERLGRRSDSAFNRMRARALLVKAAVLLKNTDPVRSSALARRADQLTERLIAEYRLACRDWAAVSKKESSSDRLEAAKQLYPWLVAMRVPNAGALEDLVSRNEKGGQ